ncbi:hypothetical protein TBR22_A12420 [Luteitalea sp. TBR-22]|uniref:hypothetical protein n=1 Tax=Luteitalea sp. TBR-22 TaxID=2802971 RepID=UPI001AF5264B|nr:hypothetical protein [Luteitalea sp. TBR-22]BCS32037.1 hypothetical protein TBR22_A12420 [Luteitalea sp. TBR-22]
MGAIGLDSLLCCAGLLALLPATGLAQVQPAHAHAASPSRLGTVHMATSCATSTSATFDRGLALLHSFWFSEAIKSFDAVLAADPDCAMAHWGIAMSWWGNPFAGSRAPAAVASGRAAVEAGRRSRTATPRERAYVEAAGQLFREDPALTPHARLEGYARAMGEVAARNPDDVEARIFHALALTQSALPTDKTYAVQLQAAAILEAEYARQPDHPGLAHYIIHTYDVPALAPKALGAARRYAAIAPDAAHALHMPSHTFTRVGAWQDSIDTNLASAEAARKDGAVAEQLHALDYQAYAYLQMGNDAAARRTVEALPDLAPRMSTVGAGNAAPPMAGYYALAAIPARFALEREAWAEAAALAPTSSPFAWADAVTRFARAIGAARSGALAQARDDTAALGAIAQRLAAAGEAYWAGQVDIQRRAAQAWVLLGEGRRVEARALMQDAADREDATEKAAVTPGPIAPARELLGDMLMALDRPAEALAAYEATLRQEPGRRRATRGAAEAARAAGSKR